MKYLFALIRRVRPAKLATEPVADRKLIRYERWLEKQLKQRERGDVMHTRAHRMI